MFGRLAWFINIVPAEQALRQAAAELWPSGHKQIPQDYICSFRHTEVLGLKLCLFIGLVA